MSSARQDPANPAERPLTGHTVIDFTRILSGPFATMLLADLGADVIKIEHPGHGDDTRGWGPPFWKGMSTYFAAVNRGKRSVALDLGDPRGRAAVRELIEHADILVENFRPGVADRLGIGYEELRHANPGLVYASINGFGSHGPKSREAGTEVIIEAESGLMAMMGVPDGPPVRFGVAMVDIATGMALVNGVLAALLRRTETGVGQCMEFSLYGTAISVLATVIAAASVSPDTPQSRWGSGHPSIVPYAAFEAKDGWLVLGAVNDEMWVRLCDGLGLGKLATDERCVTNAARVRNRAFVDAAVAEAVSSLSSEVAVRTLTEHSVLSAPVRTAAQAIEDPQIEALGLLDSDDGVLFARSPLSQFNATGLQRAPALGQHSREVLGTVAGSSPTTIEELFDAGVLRESADDGEVPPDDLIDLSRHAAT